MLINVISNLVSIIIILKTIKQNFKKVCKTEKKKLDLDLKHILMEEQEVLSSSYFKC